MTVCGRPQIACHWPTEGGVTLGGRGDPDLFGQVWDIGQVAPYVNWGVTVGDTSIWVWVMMWVCGRPQAAYHWPNKGRHLPSNSVGLSQNPIVHYIKMLAMKISVDWLAYRKTRWRHKLKIRSVILHLM